MAVRQLPAPATSLLRRIMPMKECTSSMDGMNWHGSLPGGGLAQKNNFSSALGQPQDHANQGGVTPAHEASDILLARRRICGSNFHPCFSLRRDRSTEASSSDTYIYNGPLSQTLRNLKRLSISGAVVSIFGSPVLVMNAAESMPLAAQASICFTIASFGIFTTSLLHWFTSPYVHWLRFDRGLRRGEAKTLSILARPQVHSFQESEVQYPDTMRPQVTFQVRGKPFYLDPNAFEDKDLLQRLSPLDPSETSTVPQADDNGKS